MCKQLVYIISISFIYSFHILQDVDPCEDLTDDDIRTAIQNATGPKSALFVPDVGLSTNFPFCLYRFWRL